jgi:transposase-like protein
MEDGMGRRGYSAEFRRRVLGLIEAGRSVATVAMDLRISEQTIYTWRRQERIDNGLEAGLSSTDHAELAAARRRIRELEAEVEIHRRATELLRSDSRPKDGTRRSK